MPRPHRLHSCVLGRRESWNDKPEQWTVAGEVWVWSAGFCPGSHPGEIRHGEADPLQEAKAEFLPAWMKFAQSRTRADFAEWRDQRERTEMKYRLRDAGLPIP